MKSVGSITTWHRIFILMIWLLFLAGLNFLAFAPFMGYKYGFSEVFFVIFLWVLTYFFIKNTKYLYEIKDGFLIIQTPRKKGKFKIPLSDIEKVGVYKNIPFHFRIGLKYDFLNKILFLCGYSSKWIILKLKNFENQIVICPRKFDEFLSKLQNKAS